MVFLPNFNMGKFLSASIPALLVVPSHDCWSDCRATIVAYAEPSSRPSVQFRGITKDATAPRAKGAFNRHVLGHHNGQ
jgi:hypothetical protein